MVSPSVTNPSPLADALMETRAIVDAALDRQARFPADCPPRLAEAIRYCLLAPGKRLRPTLVLWSAAACGCQCRGSDGGRLCGRNGAYLFAGSRRFAGDGRRRSPPRAADLPQGVWRGECHPGGRCPAGLGVRDARPRYRAGRGGRGLHSGVGGSGGGHGTGRRTVEDLAAGAGAAAGAGFHGDAALDLDALEAIHRRKTGAMFVVSLRLGAIVAGADAPRRAALEEYGRKLGLAFQIADDLLDVQGSEAARGQARSARTRGRESSRFPVCWGSRKAAGGRSD